MIVEFNALSVRRISSILLMECSSLVCCLPNSRPIASSVASPHAKK
jgi:hypothetical protein